MYTATREYSDAAGKPIAVACTAAVATPERAQLVCLLVTHNRALMQKHTSAVGALVAELLRGPDRRPTPMPETVRAESRRGGKAGGGLIYGAYACVLPLKAIHSERRYTLTLYENNEWRTTIDGKESKTGTYQYNSMTGQIDIDVQLNLYNSRYNNDDTSIYFRDAAGTAMIIAEDDYGVGTHRTTCRHFAAATDVAPSVAKARQAAARAEADRYKYVTEPGRGLPLAQVEAVFHHGESVYQMTGLAFVESDTLLLKDGTVRFGLPCAPADLDVAASRKYEPKAWGVWRSAPGGKLEVRRADETAWGPLKGFAVLRAGVGEKLSGTFSTRSAYGTVGAVSTFYQSYTFQPTGQFSRYDSSLHGSTMTSTMATGASVSAAGDNHGASAGGSGPGFAVATSTKRPNTGDASGAYRLDGYTLELRYDNGTVLRVPAYFWNAKRDNFSINGRTFSNEASKK